MATVCMRSYGRSGPPAATPSSPHSDSYESDSSVREAIRRSCKDADVAARDIPYVEMHGCGVSGRDRAEMTALSEAFGPDTVVGCTKARVGHTGASAGLLSVLGATLSLYRKVLPAAAGHNGTDPTPWVRDRVDGPRRTGVLAVSRGESCSHVILEESEVEATPKSQSGAEARTAASSGGLPLSEGLFVVEGDDDAEIVAGLRELQNIGTEAATDAESDAATDAESDAATDAETDAATDPVTDVASDAAPEAATDAHRVGAAAIHLLAKSWWNSLPSRPDARLAITLIARDARELRALGRSAADQLERGDDPSDRSAGRVFFSRDPLGPGGELAFVYPGSGNQYAGMGRETLPPVA